MILQITKNQLNTLLEGKYENVKPSKDFDKKYGTNLSQKWDFGKGIDSDEVWDIIHECFEERKCRKLSYLVEDLDEKIFPYPGVSSLPIRTKIHILQGMASEFNFDDIVHFSIENKTGVTDKPFGKFYKKLTEKEKDDLQWIPSKKTLEIVKKIFNK